MSPKLSLAIMSLAPGARFVLRGSDLSNLEWLDADEERPSDEAIRAELARLRNPAPPPISDRQFAHALWRRGVITKEEALAFVRVGAIPASLAGLIQALPAEEQDDAEMLVSGSITFDVAHPLVDSLARAFGWTTQELHDFWRFAGAL